MISINIDKINQIDNLLGQMLINVYTAAFSSISPVVAIASAAVAPIASKAVNDFFSSKEDFGIGNYKSLINKCKELKIPRKYRETAAILVGICLSDPSVFQNEKTCEAVSQSIVERHLNNHASEIAPRINKNLDKNELEKYVNRLVCSVLKELEDSHPLYNALISWANKVEIKLKEHDKSLQLHSEILKEHTKQLENNKNTQPQLIPDFYKNDNKIIGRETKLVEISTALSGQKKENGSRCVFICGIGGIGKSVLVKKYAEERQNEYKKIIEISASSFKDAILSIKMDGIHIEQMDNNTAFIYKKNQIIQSMQKESVLLIVHDYNTSDDPDASQWKTLPCDLLITTWNDWSGFGKQVNLDTFDLTSEDAAEIFREYYLFSANNSDNSAMIQKLEANCDNEKDKVTELVETVSRHPLTIRLLACQMTCNEDNILSPKDMLQELQNIGIDEVSHKYEEFHNTHVSVSSKSEMSFLSMYGHLEKIFVVALKNNKIDKEALEALRYMTLISPQYGICAKRFQQWTEINSAVLNFLKKGGWLEYRKDVPDPLESNLTASGVYIMPMVIGEMLYRQAGMESNIDNTKHFLDEWEKFSENHSLLADERKSLLFQTIQLADKLKEEESSNYAYFLNAVGNYIEKTAIYPGILKKALNYKEKALNICRKVLGNGHPNTATIYNNVGYSYGYLGNHNKALDYNVKALKIRLKVLGDEHPDTASSYNNVGSSYGDLGNHNMALYYKEKALNIYRNILGDEHPDTATIYNNVGSSYGNLGIHNMALNHYEKALNIRLKVLGDEHPDTASSYNNVGSSYGYLGKHNMALNHYEKALNIYRKVFGDEHPKTATIYNNVGSSYGDLGVHNMALNHYEKALNIRLKVLDKTHIDTAESYKNVGYSYGCLDKYQKALDYYEKALDIFLKIFGEVHINTAESYNNIGYSYFYLRDYQNALKYLEKALSILIKVFGEAHSNTLTAYSNIAYYYDQLGDSSKAAEYRQKITKYSEE